MVLLKKFKKLIPSYRHKTDVKLFDNTPSSLTYSKKLTKNNTKNLIKRKKIIYKHFFINLNFIYNNNLNIITKNYIYQTKPYKKYLVSTSLNGTRYITPGIENVNPGKILYSHSQFKYVYKTFFLKGFITYLHKLPTNSLCSNATNLCNNKITFAKSGGTYCKLKKNKKSKKKLLLLQLPSTQEILLTKNTKVYVGKNQNFKTNQLVEGKWGAGFSLKKKIAVRGVAMNPVDHPNGGRTKTVQPERSP